jgi:hypothetical protein
VLVEQRRLLRDLTVPQRFLSFAIWDSREAIEGSGPDLPAMIDAMRPHLDSMHISTPASFNPSERICAMHAGLDAWGTPHTVGCDDSLHGSRW